MKARKVDQGSLYLYVMINYLEQGIVMTGFVMIIMSWTLTEHHGQGPWLISRNGK